MIALQTLWIAANDALRGYVERQRAIEELSGMTDRELADIGITRGEIRTLCAVKAEKAPADVESHRSARPKVVGGTALHA